MNMMSLNNLWSPHILALVPFPPIIRNVGTVLLFGSALIWVFAAWEKWKELHDSVQPTDLQANAKKSLPLWAILVLLVISLAFGTLLLVGMPG
ncbi:MAG: hypothetical protein HKL95_11490 [Phycisphaerae bacterium]|nr:hypothetical protein [Phycisphaerae bacterium]